MSLRYWLYMGPTLGHVDVTDRMRLGLDFEEKAEEGAAGLNTITFDDPDGTLDLSVLGHHSFGVEETDIADPDDRFVAVGFIGECKVKRGPYRTGAARQWECEVSDPNTMLSRLVMVGKDNARPAETDVARVQWAEGTGQGDWIDDHRYLATGSPVDMDTNDYLLQDLLAVFNDCAQQSGKNYFITYFGDSDLNTVGNPWGDYSLFYDFADGDTYQSTARLTNDLADIDNVTTFPLFIEDELSIDPMRIYSTVYVPYKGSYVTARRQATATEYAWRESVMPAANVSTKAKATARANRYTNDLKSPEHRATVTTIVPRQYATIIRAGMAVQVKATHWPGYETSYQWMRVLSRRIVEVSESDDATYELHLELSRSVPTVPGNVRGMLYEAHGPYGLPTDVPAGVAINAVYFRNIGDTPPTGKGVYPTVGPISGVSDAGFRYPWKHYAWEMGGDGSVDYHLEMSLTGVRARSVTYTVQLQLVVGHSPYGVGDFEVLASTSFAVPADGSGFSRFTTSGAPGTIALVGTVDVSNGDRLYASLTCTPGMAFFMTPSGVGGGYNNFEITGGSLV